ncbi:MAG: hypothetical protein HY049_04115 [Acidobacteria bacterium]|nr:hypothetical protein [Acidobacteriota bacterium]
MSRIRWIVLIAVVLIGAAFLVAYTFQKARPDIPADGTHLAARGNPVDCMTCHGSSGASPRSPNHPPGRGNCEQCHYWAGEPR